jgi:hypothetical protein
VRKEKNYLPGIVVTKADGRKVPFDASKIEASCIRAGATAALARKVVDQIERQLYDGITTREIYRMVLAALVGQTDSPEIKHRYRLKESIMLMGPSEFNFESFIARVLEENGYRIESLRSKIRGKCVDHEVDIVAISLHYNNSRIMVECKYHNFRGTFTGIKESLYTHARFLDLRESNEIKFDKEMLVSNTQISQDAVKYSSCVGQEVLSWRYPPERGLERLIEQKGLYPLTILHLSPSELYAFSKMGVLVARDILNMDAKKMSVQTGIAPDRISRLQDQVKQFTS